MQRATLGAVLIQHSNSLLNRDRQTPVLNIDGQTCCSMPSAVIPDTHSLLAQHDTIRPASPASGSTPRPASAASEEPRFSSGSLKRAPAKETEIWPKTSLLGNDGFPSSRRGIAEKTNQNRPTPIPPTPPLITPSSLREVMNEAPARGAFVIRVQLGLTPRLFLSNRKQAVIFLVAHAGTVEGKKEASQVSACTLGLFIAMGCVVRVVIPFQPA